MLLQLLSSMQYCAVPVHIHVQVELVATAFNYCMPYIHQNNFLALYMCTCHRSLSDRLLTHCANKQKTLMFRFLEMQARL